MSWSVFLVDETLPIRAPVVGRLVWSVVGGVVYDHVQRIRIRYGWIVEALDVSQANELIRVLDSQS